jgi:hypothetical protein
MQTPLEYFKMDRTALRIYSSHEEAHNDALENWLSRPPQERVAAVEYLRMIHHGPEYHPTSARIQRVYQIIERGEG